MKRKTIISILILLAAGVCAFFILRSCKGSGKGIVYETSQVTRGSVKITVTATGTIQAIQTIKVGTQVSGKISRIYADYNSHVKTGELLAELDRKPLENSLTMSEAALDDAKAVLTYQTSTYNRTKALYEKKLIAESAYDEAFYNFQKALISIKSAQLNYDQAKINLGYAFIYSPIDGVVLDRSVSEGQTVAASFSTPTLFTIAHDLTQMQVEASVDEADIGNIRMGQKVSFTVDAYSEDQFSGEVTQIRLQPVTTSNVVTYTVIIRAPNKEQKLMPGMTASITAFVKEATNVLVVSSQALQFKPEGTTETPAQAMYPQAGGAVSGKPPFPPTGSVSGTPPMPGVGSSTPPPLSSEPSEISHKLVWVKRGNSINPVMIETGLDDDMNVQIISGLKEGDEVVISAISGTSQVVISKADTTQSSPFMPKPPQNKNKNSGPPPPPG
jgi:HlyD family secretion protein